MHASVLTFTAAALVLFIAESCSAAEGLGRGLGDEIDWKTLDEGLLEAKETKKPLMLIVHKSWCGACKAFKPQFAASKEIQEMSKHFVMVNTQDDEEPKDPKYTPDGGYIPRVLFLDPAGEVRTHIYNKGGNANYKYFYSSADAVLQSMKVAMEEMNNGEKEL